MSRSALLVVTCLGLLSSTGCSSLLRSPGSLMALDYALTSSRGTFGDSVHPGAPSDRGLPIDMQAENRQTMEYLNTLDATQRDVEYQVIVVPGFAAKNQSEPLHPRAKKRLELALKAFEDKGSLAILLSGGNVWPVRTPYNEALEMKRYLLERGFPVDRILVDTRARHSTTNLRNAGRAMLGLGLSRAMVVTTPLQSFYFGWPLMSSYHFRCLAKLGYTVGSLSSERISHVRFQPSRSVLLRGEDPLDP